MNSKLLGTGIVALALVGLAGASFTSAPRTERIDFGAAPRAVGAVYNPTLAPASAAPVKEFRIPIRDAKLDIASGVTYNGWSFGGTVPGPVIRVREGDLVRILLVNEASLPHSIDFHAARILTRESSVIKFLNSSHCIVCLRPCAVICSETS